MIMTLIIMMLIKKKMMMITTMWCDHDGYWTRYTNIFDNDDIDHKIMRMMTTRITTVWYVVWCGMIKMDIGPGSDMSLHDCSACTSFAICNPTCNLQSAYCTVQSVHSAMYSALQSSLQTSFPTEVQFNEMQGA